MNHVKHEREDYFTLMQEKADQNIKEGEFGKAKFCFGELGSEGAGERVL